jgi:hypothetical protein
MASMKSKPKKKISANRPCFKNALLSAGVRRLRYHSMRDREIHCQRNRKGASLLTIFF